MARKKNKKVKLEDQVVFIHFREPSGEWNFSITVVKNLLQRKMSLLLEGKTHIEIPYFDTPLVVQKMNL